MRLRYFPVFVLAVLILISGCIQEAKETEIVQEKGPGSGILVIETIPSKADVILDSTFKGLSPITIYNVPAGPHTLLIKKVGYGDYIMEIKVEAAKKSYFDATLISLDKEENVVEESIPELPEPEEEPDLESIKASGVVNIGDKFSVYYDFSEGKFEDKRSFESDTFSKRYQDQLLFTRFNPVNIKVIDKSIEDVEKEDCEGIKGQLGTLISGQSLCIITIEGEVAALGGTWETTENADLTWKLFN